jgi:hypothetical protein
MTGIYPKPGMAIRVAAFAFLTEQADFRQMKRWRKKKRKYTAAQRAEYKVLREKHPEIGAPRRPEGMSEARPTGMRMPSDVWRALHRKPAPTQAAKPRVTLPRLRFEDLP